MQVAVVVGACLGLVEGCRSDPILETEIRNLESVVPNEAPNGEYHRPGQPCTHCHNDVGSVAPEFSVAGTIFLTKSRPRGAGNVKVILYDSAGQSRVVTTNCVGNFFIGRTKDLASEKEDIPRWDPQFPLKVTVQYTDPGGQTVERKMNTLINRDGSCSGCHFSKGCPDKIAQVWVLTEDKGGAAPNCRYSPASVGAECGESS
jgi:hypothetical protein